MKTFIIEPAAGKTPGYVTTAIAATRMQALAIVSCLTEDDLTLVDGGYHPEAEDLWAAVYKTRGGRQFRVYEKKVA